MKIASANNKTTNKNNYFLTYTKFICTARKNKL